jgi:hypothetical protein
LHTDNKALALVSPLRLPLAWLIAMKSSEIKVIKWKTNNTTPKQFQNLIKRRGKSKKQKQNWYPYLTALRYRLWFSFVELALFFIWQILLHKNKCIIYKDQD